MGPKGKVVMIDHIKDIIQFACNNINKKNSILLKKKRIIPLTMDGRKGYKEGGPYDVIHIGGAIERIP